MPRFQFTASAADGSARSGEIEAASAADAAQRLEREGLKVASIAFAGADAGVAAEAFPLSKGEFVAVSGQIADLTHAKLPFHSGLRMLAAELPNRRLRRALLGIAGKLERGMDLDQALLAYDAPKELQAVFAAGKRSGRLADVLAQYVTHRRSRANSRLTLSLALGYPVIMLVVASIIIVFGLLFLVPSFQKILNDYGTRTPVITQILFSISDACIRYGWIIFAGIIVAGAAAYIAFGVFRRSSGWQSVLRYIPLVGTLWHWASMSQFCHLLAVMLENRVPLPEALLLAGDGADDEGIRAGSRRMAATVAAGEPLSSESGVMRGFPASFIQVVTEHKQTDALPGALHAIADFFERRSRLQSDFLAAVCGPLIVVFVAMSVGSMVIALFTPLVRLLNDLS